MKVLHLDIGREMRGGQWQVLALHRGLLQRGHDSMLLARGPLETVAKCEGLPCAPLTLVRAAMLARHPDVIHAHDARSHSLAAVAVPRARLVVSRRVAFPVRDTALSRWKYARPAMFLAVSRFVAERLKEAGVEDERIVVVYDGVAIPARAAEGNDVLALHTLDPAKGLALAQAAARLANIELKTTTDLLADLPRSRALVYLTHSEGLGSGILHAMAHGVTPVASDVGGIPELIQTGVHGILVRNEERAVALALTRIDAALGRAARIRVKEQFSEDRMVERTVTVYEKVLGGKQ